jgi:hypothetical protein
MNRRGVNKQPGTGFFGVGSNAARQRRAGQGMRDPAQVTEHPIVVRNGRQSLMLSPQSPIMVTSAGLDLDLDKLIAMLKARGAIA